jgi:hypothetical protein
VTLPGPFLSISGGSRQGLWLDNLHLVSLPQLPSAGHVEQEHPSVVQVDSRALWMTNVVLTGSRSHLQAISLARGWLLLASVPCCHHISTEMSCEPGHCFAHAL